MRRLLYGWRRPRSPWRPPALTRRVGYFSAQNADILQPAQKVFITWDPVKQVESFTVQPSSKGMPSTSAWSSHAHQPKLHEMPRDFFKHSPSIPSSRSASPPTPNCCPNRC